MRAGSLFTGGGGLDLAVEQLFPDVEWAWHAEVDKHASKLLERHWPDVPNLGDLSKVDWTKVAPVDVLMGGYPCQPWSNAGKRKGQADARDGWPWFRDAVRHLGPRYVLLENVAGHVVPDGAGRTVGDLSALGFDCRWAVVRASDVGAPHRRARWFCVADSFGERGQLSDFGGQPGFEEPVGDGTSGGAGLTLLPTPAVNDMGRGKTVDEWDAWTDRMREAHGNGNGHGKSLAVEAQRLLPTPRATRGGSHTETQKLLPTPRANKWGPPDSHGHVPDALLPTPRASEQENRTTQRTPSQDAGKHGLYLSVEVQPSHWGDYAEAIARWEQILGRQAPAPTDAKGRLSPEFVEFLMGWPDGWTEPLTRTQRLKVLGNGVVPLQAVHAYGSLLQGVPA